MILDGVSLERNVDDLIISLKDVSKIYNLYLSNEDRLKEALHPFRKRYHEKFEAILGVSFGIRKGESVGILGRNGAGKSTLLQLIAGVLTPTSGNVCVAGRVSALLELGAGFNPDLTGRQNVILVSAIQGIEEHEISERLSKIEAFADIGRFFDQPMRLYSSGMFARVAFANAIHVDPDILIVDEILGVGDSKFQEKCYHQISLLKQRGVCILFVSHDAEVVHRNCSRALLIDGGRLIMDGSTDETVAAYHDLLYGAKNFTRSLKLNKNTEKDILDVQPNSNSFEESITINSLLNNASSPYYTSRVFYNNNERRFGDGGAEITDLVMCADNKVNFNVLSGNEIIDIYIKVIFNRDVARPQVGWALVSPEGITIAGSNTFMQNVVLDFCRKNETRIYKLEIKLAICGGQYFFNLGVGEYNCQEWIFLDERRSICHISVSDSGLASGFIQIPSTFKEIT